MADTYRELTLVNGNGDKWSLNDKSLKIIATNLQGLGASRSLATLRLGDEQQIVSSQYEFTNIGYDVYFYNDLITAYQQYNTFIRFLSYKPLYQEYVVPFSKSTFRRRVEIISIGKTEYQHNYNALVCPVALVPLTFWEDGKSTIIETGNTTDIGKMYPLERPYVYGTQSLANIEINTSGLLETPFELTINGTVTDPTYYIYDKDNVLYGAGKFLGTFDKVYVNSEEINQQIVLERNGIILDDPYSYQDNTVGQLNQTKITFLKFKAGKSKIAIIVDQGFTGTTKIEYRNRYVSV